MKIVKLFLAFLMTLSMRPGSRENAEPEEPTTVILRKNGEKQTITVEDYVTGVVLGEMPPSFEKEALKAQAVAARSYYYYCLAHHSHPHDGADVCDDPNHCCSYETVETLGVRFGKDYAEKAYSVIREAVSETAGEVLVWGGGTYEDAICAVWHSSSYGMTEDSGEVFLVSLPYLQPVRTEEEALPVTSFVSRRELLSLLGKEALSPGILSATVTYHGFLRCDELTLGNVTLSGSEARSLFGLRSTSFTVKPSHAGITFCVYGFGHGVGMSQYGAEAMAKKGADAREILSHYYTGAVWFDGTKTKKTEKTEKSLFSSRCLDSIIKQCYDINDGLYLERK